MSKTVQELQQEIDDINNKIKDIQNNCKHPDYEVVMYSWRPGAFYPTRMCTICRSTLPGITYDEEQECRKDFFNPLQTGSFVKTK